MINIPRAVKNAVLKLNIINVSAKTYHNGNVKYHKFYFLFYEGQKIPKNYPLRF